MPKVLERRSHFGCVEEVVKGRKYRLRWCQDTPQGRRRMSETLYGTRREAKARMSELEVLYGRGGARGGCPTVGRVWEEDYLPFLDAMIAAGRAKAGTKDTYTQIWRKHVGPAFGRVPVDQVRTADVQGWLLGLSESVGMTAKAVLKNVLDRAAMAQHIQSNPIGGKMIYSTRRAERSKETWDLETLSRVDEAMRGHALETAYLLQAHAGMRVGESLAVRPLDVAFVETERGMAAAVSVSATVRPDGTLGPTKTGKGRTTYMAEPWSLRLRELCRAAASPDEYLTGGAFGPYTVARCGKLWRAVELPDGVPAIPMRNLRPSFETYMRWELGVPARTVQLLLGHASVKTTDASYDRPKGEDVMMTAVPERVAIDGALGRVRDK